MRCSRPFRSKLLVLAIPLLGFLPAAGEAQLELQSPPDLRPYPVGNLFIQELDAIWTAAGHVHENASILIRDGIIEAIGPGIEPPEGVQVLDGRGRTAIPGIVDEHSHIAQVGTNEGTAPIVPEVRVLDALDPTSFGIYQALSGGITTARIMHGSSNPIGGQSAVIKMRWGMEDSRELLVPGAPRAVKFALGENVTRKAAQARGPASRFPASRPGVAALYEQAFTAAREYRELWEAYEADPGSFTVPPRRDLRLEALVDIMEDRILVHAHSYRNDEILQLMRVAERFGFTIDNFTHVLEGYRIADELREHGAGASTFSDWWQFKLEAYDAIPYNATLMNERGVLVAVNSDIPWLQSFMKWEIAKPVQYGGASREDALRMLTLNPAVMIGIDDRVGSLEEGKEGDVAILTGDPFDAFSRVEYTVVDGIVYYDSNAEEETRGEMIADFPRLDRDRFAAPDVLGVFNGNEAGSATGSDQVQAPPVSRVDMGGAEPPNPRAETVALVGATIHPVSGPAIQDGALVLRDGRIQAVGPRGQVEVPSDARQVDVAGRHIYPGMIDPVTHLGLYEFGQVSQATDRTENGDFNPHIRALPAYQPHGRAPFVARARGITSVLTAQTGGMIEAMGSVVDLQGDTWERAEIRGHGALMVNLPVPGSAAGRDTDADPSLDTGRMDELVAFFTRAREYQEGPAVSRRADEPFEANIWGGDSVVLDAMLPVMRGEVPVFLRANSRWQIRHALLFLEEFPELDGVVVGGSEAFHLADELARREIPVVLTGTRSPTSSRDESILANMKNAAVLEAAGVRIAFATDESADVRNLPEHAAIAVAHGLPAEAGLAAVTLGAARVLGLSDELGSLEAGKRADLLVTDGNPLQPLTRIETMFIAGVEVDPRDNDHTRAYERFRERR
jgi:imidazolonepropionase-like amidohydrolase